jgi:predicted membrane-bound mannosyltransferase
MIIITCISSAVISFFVSLYHGDEPREFVTRAVGSMLIALIIYLSLSIGGLM